MSGRKRIVVHTIKKIINEKKMAMAEEVGPAMEKRVSELISCAIYRAKANQRTTVMARDL